MNQVEKYQTFLIYECRKKGFPKGYYSEQQPEKARVFQYTGYKVINNNYDDLKEGHKEQ